MNKYYILLVCLILSLSTQAQRAYNSALPPQYVLYSLEDSKVINSKLQENTFPMAVAIFEEVGLYKITLDQADYERLDEMSSTLNLQLFPNTPVSHRDLPNDPGVASMWSIEAMNLEQAWNFEQDGQTPSGEDIVVAIIDKGFDTAHEDLRNNTWINKDEIPDNDIDDDNNGYIDDYNAYDFLDKVGYLDPDNTHGTPIAGIIGAEGNNGIGSAGIMWHPKLMNLGPAYLKIDIIEALEYIYTRRKAFNDTRGEEGDFIVAVNCSWGWDNAFPSAYPGICSTIEKLGEVGVLVAVAVTNAVKDITEKGDIPATCMSSNMIAVTSINDKEEVDGGYSSKYVNIVAPGRGIYTTFYDNSYSSFSGTSAATPHVAGSIGFLYDMACEKFYEDIYENPRAVALKIKRLLLDNVRVIPSLAGKVNSTGIVDLFAASVELLKECGSANIGDIAITNNNIYPNPVSGNSILNVEITHPDFKTYKFDIFNTRGQLMKEVIFETNPETSIAKIDVTGYPSGMYYVRFYRCPNNNAADSDCQLGKNNKMGRYLRNTDIAIGKFIVQ